MSANQLRSWVKQLAQTCEEHAYSWVLTHEPSTEELKTDLPEIVASYVQSAALLASDWYEEQDPESSYFAIPMDAIPDERLENAAVWVNSGPQRPENKIRVAAHKMVFDAARDTIYRNAQDEGVAVVRYEYADSCEGCVARATTSARARNSRSDDLAFDFHPSCEGLFLPVRSGLWEPPDYARQWRTRIEQARLAGNANADDIAKWLSAN